MQNMRVRLATVEDFEALDRIRAAAFEPVFASFRALVGASIASVAFRDAEREQQVLLRDLFEPNDEHITLVAEREGVVCGFCAVMCKAETKVGEIGLNAVHPNAQCRGVGQALYIAALDHMRAQGMRVATVGTGGDDSHSPARAAYGKVGFTAAVPSFHLYRVL